MTTVTLEFLAAQMERLLGAVAAVETRIGGLEVRLGELETRVGALEGEVRGLRASHEALDQRVRDMTADGKLTLSFLARQNERLLDEQGRLRDDMTVVSGMVMRLEGTVQGLTVEVRGEHSRYDRLAREVARLREPAPG
jgi:predicted nuclease with TOPRIM domain